MKRDRPSPAIMIYVYVYSINNVGSGAEQGP